VECPKQRALCGNRAARCADHAVQTILKETAMTEKTSQTHADESSMEKDPDERATGDESMTGAQRSHLKTVSEEANVPFDHRLTQAAASKRIDELQAKTGRVKSKSNDSERGGLVSPDPTDNPGSLGDKQEESRPTGAPSSA
jgi:hypothetical protein